METNDIERFDEFVQRMEFHEIKCSGIRQPIINLEVYVKEGSLEAFCKWLAGSSTLHTYEGEFLSATVAKLLRSKREDPTFTLSTPECTVTVHPKKNMVSYCNGGIHYVCLHCFDMFSYFIRSLLMHCYHIENRTEIGQVFPRVQKIKSKSYAPLPIYDHDIHVGFMQSFEQNQIYHDDFVEFIRARRREDAERQQETA